ncbi:MAG: hypothetical protein HYV35_06340 [Lentisphaerae bacterium]|nr:hypothetical protein [Lentisphaerota bacterium]
MSPASLQSELMRIGRILNRSQAEIRAALFVAATLGAMWLMTISDLFLRYQRAGRLIAWLVLVGGGMAGIFLVVKALRARRTPQGVAARLEHAFPLLDNHLINTLQFAQREQPDLLEQQYLERAAPDFALVKIKALLPHKTRWRAYVMLLLAGLIFFATGAWVGSSWNNALARLLNPFSARAPTTLAVIKSVTPGNGAALKGASLTLECKATGKPGQLVSLDLWPADDKRAALKLGKLTGNGEETFSYLIPRLATSYQYRFRAGDAISDRFAIKTLSALAFTRLAVTVTPPAALGLETRSFDGLTNALAAHENSILAVELEGNRELAAATLTTTNSVELASADGGKTWKGQIVLSSAQGLVVKGRDAHNTTAETTLKITVIPDAPPEIRVIAPEGRTHLAAGAAPRIQWEVSDDFGLSAVRLESSPEQTVSVGAEVVPGLEVQSWAPDGAMIFSTNWSGEGFPFSMTKPLVLRIVALDNRAGGKPNRTVSAPIVFEWTTSKDLASQNKVAADKLAETIKSLVERQRVNLEKTTALEAGLKTFKPDDWRAALQAQQLIRQITGQLLADPAKPLSTLAEPVRTLYQGAMLEVIDVLERIAPAPAPDKTTLARQAILLETRILRVLTSTETGLDAVRRNQEISSLLSQLDALVKGQETVLVQTRSAVTNAAVLSAALVDKQDRLSGALTEFVQTCRKEAVILTASDQAFSAILSQIADGCESNKIPALMLKAAECLENKQPAKAIPPQSETLAALTSFQKLLNSWRIQDATQTMADLRTELQEASKKMDKLIELETKSLDGIRETMRQKDASGKAFDEFEEEYAELHEQTKEALLQIATDLQVFPELPVGNDLVEDVFQVFEEVKQKPGSEKAAIEEVGLQKEDFILDYIDSLKDTKKRIDDVECWLPAAPDSERRLIESFDSAEMPEIPIIPLASEAEDIIGELAEQEEELAKQADDSAGNQGVPDMSMGWDIAEGEWTSYAAKGKSGNRAPDHKEQDGRSIIGRQGMADGETTAGSGKISEGDENIEKRMTQDSSQSGQVQEEGHTKAKATGGGKGSGYGDELGMSGSGPRRDSKVSQGSEQGLQALLKRNAQALYARSELSHIRTGSLDEAIRWMQQAEDAMAKGYPIQQVREFQRRAVKALKKSRTELGGAVMDSPEGSKLSAPPIDDQLAGVRDEAPATYRELVAEYFKALSAAP